MLAALLRVTYTFIRVVVEFGVTDNQKPFRSSLKSCQFTKHFGIVQNKASIYKLLSQSKQGCSEFFSLKQ